MGQESMSECELLRAEIESLKIDLQAMLGLRRTGSTSTIEKRLERVEAILDARGLDWDHPKVEGKPSPVDFGDKDHPAVMRQTMVFSLSQSDKNQPANEPPKKWRILEPGEEVQEGDWYADAFYPRQCWPPSKGAWLEVKVDSVKVGEVATSGLVFARPVAEEPPKPAEPEYREPVLPADAGERCEFSNDGNEWRNGSLDGYLKGYAHSGWRDTNGVCWQHARIK